MASLLGRSVTFFLIFYCNLLHASLCTIIKSLWHSILNDFDATKLRWVPISKLKIYPDKFDHYDLVLRFYALSKNLENQSRKSVCSKQFVKVKSFHCIKYLHIPYSMIKDHLWNWMNKAKGTANYEKEVCVCEVGQIVNLIIVVVTEAFDCGSTWT